jgi:hypothetical protein
VRRQFQAWQHTNNLESAGRYPRLRAPHARYDGIALRLNGAGNGFQAAP